MDSIETMKFLEERFFQKNKQSVDMVDIPGETRKVCDNMKIFAEVSNRYSSEYDAILNFGKSTDIHGKNLNCWIIREKKLRNNV